MSRKPTCRIVGGGPAGLYLALELARREARFDIELLHHEAPSHGVGVVLDAGLVDTLEQRDPHSGKAIRAACETWDVVRLRLGEATLATGGHVIYGIDRGSLLAILRERVQDLGGGVVERQWTPGDQVDLLVGADGAGSRVRQSRQDEFGCHSSAGRTWYLWMRASGRLPAGFLFARNDAGLLVAHVYPYRPSMSAVVMECRPEVARAGLDTSREAAERELTRLFADQLGGAELRAATYPWQPFRTVHNRRWQLGDTVLVGDAAHTAHFSAGSGTRLAVEDAIALADELTAESAETAEALARYEARRRPAVEAVQADARGSQLWFEDLDRHMRLPPDQLAFALRTRRDANTYGWLRDRDPAFVARVDAALRRDRRSAATAATDRCAPSQLPLRLGKLIASNRVGVVLPHQLTGSPQPGIVIAGSPTPSGAILAELGAGKAIGAFVRPGRRDEAELRKLATTAHFAAVPIGRHGQRVERTQLAEWLRNEVGMTVLLLAPELDTDEAETLIAAGRIDGYLLGDPDWTGWEA